MVLDAKLRVGACRVATLRFMLRSEDLSENDTEILKERRSRELARHTLSLYDAEMPVRNNTLGSYRIKREI